MKIARILPAPLKKWLLKKTRVPSVGNIQPFDIYSTEPISRNWGGDRGMPIDRYYIESFLKASSDNIKGRVLEIGDNYYTEKFGLEKVEKSEVLHAAAGNPKATYVGNLEDIPEIKSDYFDCIICTQTMQLIPDLDAAINTLYRILKPGGTLLVTVPGISQIYVDEKGEWPDYWRFTKNSASLLFGKKFGEKMQITHFGNVFSSSSFLYGICKEDADKKMLEPVDEFYQMVICIKAVK